MSDRGQTTVLYIDSASGRQEPFQALVRAVFGDFLRLLPSKSDEILASIAPTAQPDCIIAAIDEDPETTAKKLTYYVAGLKLPLIALIPGKDEATGLKAMHGGADDFLMYEGLTGAQLRRAIINVIRIRALRAQALLRRREENRPASGDPITGHATRKMFLDRLAHSMVLASRAKKSFSVMVLELTHLKDINTIHGTGTGDAVLAETAKRLGMVLRQANSVARIGGRKFEVLLETGATYEGMNIAARKIIEIMDTPFRTSQGSLDISVEIGIALFPGHGEDVDSLMQNAEIAMTEANRRGTKFAVFAYDDMLSGFYDTAEAG